jgi:hypothetical protein
VTVVVVISVSEANLWVSLTSAYFVIFRWMKLILLTSPLCLMPMERLPRKTWLSEPRHLASGAATWGQNPNLALTQARWGKGLCTIYYVFGEVEVMSKTDRAAKTETAFRLFDKNRDGFITREEFMKVGCTFAPFSSTILTKYWF